MTLVNPASLPPTVMETSVVVALSVPSWLLSTSVTVAPEHAWKSSVAPDCFAYSSG